jgi:HEAT repeat protein
MSARLLPAVLFLVVGAAAADERPTFGQAARLVGSAPDAAVRARAAERLAAADDEPERRAARPLLVAALADASAPVRRIAGAGLARMPAPETRAPLLAALAREKEREVLPALLLAVGALAEPTLVETALPFTRDAAPAVRAAALTALGDLGGDAARRRLLEALADPAGPDEGWAVRSAAVLALGKVGRRGDVAAVLAALRTGEGWSCWLARSALARAVPTIDPEPLALLEHLVHDGDARVAVTAAEGFARAGHPERLRALLSSPAPGVRAAAASAVVASGLEGAEPRLVAMARGDAALEPRWAAALALFRLDAPAGDEFVLAGLASHEPVVWAEALAALERRTGARHGRDVPAWRAELARRRAR